MYDEQDIYPDPAALEAAAMEEEAATAEQRADEEAERAIRGLRPLSSSYTLPLLMDWIDDDLPF